MKRMIQGVTVILALALVLGVTGVVTGCSSGTNGGASYNDAYSSQAIGSVPPMTGDSGETAEGSGSVLLEGEERKVTKSAELSLQTKEFDTVVEQLQHAVKANGGYTADSRMSGRDIEYENNRSRSGSMTVKVPSNNYDAFMQAVEALANVTSKSEWEEDITTQYYDTSTRLESLLIWEERLMSMLTYAEDLEDMLRLEQELMNVRQQIQYNNEMMNVYVNMVDYATVHIYVQELLDTQVVPQGFFGGLGEAFGDSFNSFLRFIEVIVTVFIYLLPYLIAAGIVVMIVFLISRSSKKRRAAKPPATPSAAIQEQMADTAGSVYPQQSYPQQAYPHPQESQPPASNEPPAGPQV